jgi:hypothetical protein
LFQVTTGIAFFKVSYGLIEALPGFNGSALGLIKKTPVEIGLSQDSPGSYFFCGCNIMSKVFRGFAVGNGYIFDKEIQIFENQRWSQVIVTLRYLDLQPF